VDQVGRKVSWLYGGYRRSFEVLAQELWKAFMADPQRLGILRLLAQLSTNTAIPQIPFEYLDPQKIEDLRQRAAAIVVLLTQPKPGCHATDLARLALTIDAELQKLLSQVTEVIRYRQIETDCLNDFLLKLIPNLPSWNTKALVSAIQALDNSVRRRRTNLDDPTIWSQLRLPAV
jgi:hypothetical protein